MPTVTAHVVADIADRLFAAIESGDAATVEALWDDGVLVWKSAEPSDQVKSAARRRPQRRIDLDAGLHRH